MFSLLEYLIIKEYISGTVFSNMGIPLVFMLLITFPLEVLLAPVSKAVIASTITAINSSLNNDGAAVGAAAGAEATTFFLLYLIPKNLNNFSNQLSCCLNLNSFVPLGCPGISYLVITDSTFFSNSSKRA